ncbi:MAG: nitroreductase family protein [Deltaproteobacteria bacterium]|nr:nitroreductase family protein [Deltaproteobacteria bacterium]
MSLIHIDEVKCKKDGFCTKECPAAIIRLRDGDGFPEMVPGGEAMCIECGHCVAVCPHGALNHERVPLNASPEINRDLALSAEQVIQFLRSRRSVRVFKKDQDVEKDKIKVLIEIARYAPTASNAQPLEWLVITDKTEIKRLAGMTVNWMRRLIKDNPDNPALMYIPRIVEAWDLGYDAVLRRAPVLIVVSAPKEDPNGLVDISIALAYLELAAGHMGLGCCWAGLLQNALRYVPEIKKGLGLPERHIHHYPMMLGYAKFPYYRMPERKKPTIRWR